MKQVLVRRLTASLLLVIGVGFLGVAMPVARQIVDADRRADFVDDSPWRRTVHGWEKITSWSSPAATEQYRFHPLSFHPLILAVWMLIAAVGSLYCCSPENQQERFSR